MNDDRQPGSTPANGADGEEPGGSWSREYLIAQIVIVVGIAAAIAGVVISQDRGLASLSVQPERPAAPSGGFSIVQQGVAPPIVCPGGAPGEHPTAEDGLAADCAALLAALPTLVGDGELNWHVDEPITQWQGVIVAGDQSRVVALDLTTSGLSGQIAPELGELTALQSLHLYGNELTGRIPEELSQLGSLTILDLGGNRLTGEIPPQLGSISTLTWMDLSFNELSGPIPDELSNLERLEWLVIAGNGLSGTISGKLDSLIKLEYLSIYDTSLTGCLPDSLSEVDGLLGDLSFCDDQ